MKLENPILHLYAQAFSAAPVVIQIQIPQEFFCKLTLTTDGLYFVGPTDCFTSFFGEDAFEK